MAFQHLSSRGSPLQHHPTLPSVHLVHRFPEMSGFYMMQNHGHALDFRPTPRIPYQTCISQPLPLAHLDSVNNVVPTCQLLSALPCHPLADPRYPVVPCQSCTTDTQSSPVVTHSQNVAVQETSPSFREQQQKNVQQASVPSGIPRSPPPPTRKTVARKRRNSCEQSETILDAKYPRNGPVDKIEFRPLVPISGRRQTTFSRLNRTFASKRSSHTGFVRLTSPKRNALVDANPYKFEFNIPFPPKPKEKASAKNSNVNMPRKPRNEIPEKYQKTWPTEPVPKEGYISVLEQAINHLSERCLEDTRNDNHCNNKENVSAGNDQKDGVTKESLDKAWLQVLNKVFGRSGETQKDVRGSNISYSSSGTSGYPSECYSEVDWNSSTLESDYYNSSAEQENWKPSSSGTESDELKELLPQNFQLPPEIRQTNESFKEPNFAATSVSTRENFDNSVNDHDYSKPHNSSSFQDEECLVRDPSDSDGETVVSLKSRARSDTDILEEKNDCRSSMSRVNEDDEDDETDEEDDIRDEQEEEKATDADVETEFMSSAEHEAPKWGFLKPRLLKRSSPKKLHKTYVRADGSDTNSSCGKAGFVTPTYQCNFPTSSDSEATLGNCTPSQTRKPTPPFKSPEPVDPTFRGVTLQIRTKVEKDQVQLSIKGFFNCRKKSKQRSDYMIGQNTKSSSDSESNSSNDVIRKRKRRAYQSGKQCASCCTKKTPLWRDAEDGTPLCNACGIRYKKYRIKCHSCWNIPRKDVKMNSTCINCGENLRLSTMRNPAKFWT